MLDVADYRYVFAILAPQLWGKLLLVSPPELGDLGGSRNHCNQDSAFITQIKQRQILFVVTVQSALLITKLELLKFNHLNHESRCF